MLIDADGTRHPYEGTLRGNFPSPASSLQTFEAHTTDGSFIDYYAEGYKPQFDNSGGRNMIMAWAVLPNGTRIEYGAQANYAMYPTRITDRSPRASATARSTSHRSTASRLISHIVAARLPPPQ